MTKNKNKILSSFMPLAGGLIERRIYLIRGQKVMLDSDLAELYQVPTKRLNEAVLRNASRFPNDFMFQLTAKEAKTWTSQFAISNLRSQFATSSYGGRRYLPKVFTEQGVAMLSSVLNSERAVQVNIAIMRAFIRLRQILSTHKDILVEIRKFKQEQRYQRGDIKRIFKIIETLFTPRKQKPLPVPPMGKIGFRVD
jgi:hypothetical protein